MADEKNVPTPGDTIKREMVEAKHPDFKDRRNALRLYRESVDGTGGYCPYTDEIKISDQWPTDESHGTLQIDSTKRTYLYRHPRERKKFWRRVVMSYHAGVVRKCMRMIVGFLTKKDVSYSDYPTELTRWMESVNQRQATWRLLKNTDLVPQVLYYGQLPVLLHYPPNDATTRAQQIEAGADLVAQPISPEVMIDWQEDEAGGYRWLKYVEERDVTPGPLVESHTVQRRYHYLTQDGWWYVDDPLDKALQDWPVVASGTWDSMPLVVWRINASGSSLVHHAVQLERELLNISSLMQEIEREITYPQLVLPDPGENERAKVRGIDAILFAEPDADWTPYILAPDVKALDHLKQRVEELKGHILEEFGLEFSEGATTGVAQSFKMSKIVRLLVDLAGDLEESEYLTHAKAAEMLSVSGGLPLKSRAQWPAEFDARDVEKEVDQLISATMGGPAIGNTAQRRLRMRLVTGLDPNMDEDTKSICDDEIRVEVEGEANADTEQPDTSLDDAMALMGRQPPPTEPNAR